MTLQLSSEHQSFDAMRLSRTEDHVVLENPIAMDQTMVRRTLAPGLLETLTVNAHREYPQRIFEVGEVTVLAPETDTGARERRHVAGAVIGDKVGATDVRAAAECLLREHGVALRTRGADLPSFLPGRGAEILVVRDGQEQVVGTLGELHPEVLEAFRLRLPAAIFEVDLTALTGLA